MMRQMARVRTGLARVSSYLSLANFGILLGIVLKWLHGVVAPDIWFVVWMAGGYTIAAALVVVVALIDHKFVWPQEMGVSQSVNPLTTLPVLHVVWVLSELRARGVDTEGIREEVIEALRMSGRHKEFLKFEDIVKARD
jgi:hypothetical protein